MAASARLLVVANRTADSDELRAALLERVTEGPISVTLLVPACWEVTDPHGGRQSGLRRLRSATERIVQAGIPIEGITGDPDPVAAVEAVWDPARFDEVIVATLPESLSRWLRIDLPRRVERLTGRPVRHVVARERDATLARA
jgi:predicted NAD/FAD-binding protein